MVLRGSNPKIAKKNSHFQESVDNWRTSQYKVEVKGTVGKILNRKNATVQIYSTNMYGALCVFYGSVCVSRVINQIMR